MFKRFIPTMQSKSLYNSHRHPCGRMLRRLRTSLFLAICIMLLVMPHTVHAAPGLVFDDPSTPLAQQQAKPKTSGPPERPSVPTPSRRPQPTEVIRPAEEAPIVEQSAPTAPTNTENTPAFNAPSVEYEPDAFIPEATPVPIQEPKQEPKQEPIQEPKQEPIQEPKQEPKQEPAPAPTPSVANSTKQPTTPKAPMPRAVLLFAGYSGKGAAQKYPEYTESDIAKLLNKQSGLNATDFIITTANDRFNTFGATPSYIVTTNDISNMKKGLTGAQNDGELSFIKEHYSILLTGKLLSGAEYTGEDLGALYPDSGLSGVHVDLSAKGPASTGLTLDSFVEDSLVLAKRLITHDPTIKIWFTFPPISLEALAERYTTPYKQIVVDGVKSGLTSTQWTNNVAGFYYGTEGLSPWYTYFDSNAANFDNPVVKNMSSLSNYVRSQGKKMIWIPYYGPHHETSNTTDDDMLGSIANATNIFDYVVIQPTYYFDEKQRGNLMSVAASLSTDTVKNSDGNVVMGNKTSSTIIGVEMEVDHRISTSPPYAKRYEETAKAFGSYKRSHPVVFYAGDRNQLMYPDVIQEIKNFFK